MPWLWTSREIVIQSSQAINRGSHLSVAMPTRPCVSDQTHSQRSHWLRYHTSPCSLRGIIVIIGIVVWSSY